VSAGLIAVCARTSWACYLLTCAVGWYPLNIRAPCDAMGTRAMPTLRALRAAITAARRNIAYLGSMIDRRQGGMKPRVALTNHFRKLIGFGLGFHEIDPTMDFLPLLLGRGVVRCELGALKNCFTSILRVFCLVSVLV
jgi:hypothetical protein